METYYIDTLIFIGVLILSYLMGSIPSGLIIVKIANGKDIRQVESGRTGGTNVMRSAGFFAGLLTGLFDVLKGAASGWLAQYLLPGNPWAAVFAAIMAIMGHNYSIFLIERKSDGRLRLRGGAGGATCLGGAIALWPHSWVFIVPVGTLIYIFVGFASITTMSIALTTIVIFIYRSYLGLLPWEYIAYGVLAEMILVWSLRPNLVRLKNGTERAVGIRAYFQKRADKKTKGKASKEKRSASTTRNVGLS